MMSNRRRDTAPELRLRRLLHAAGLRYRVDWPLPLDRRRTADIVFTRQMLTVFVDGCFWHGCPQHYRAPKQNADYWADKVAGNVARDRDTDSRLAALGWTVLRFWEHEDPALCRDRVIETVRREREALARADSSGLEPTAP